MSEIFCPECGSTEWNAVESHTAVVPCKLSSSGQGVEIDFDMRAELSREAATSVVTHYLCGNDLCGFMVLPVDLGKLLT